MPDMSLFRVTYDGPSLAESAMDVRELSPALIAVADLLESANRSLNEQRASVKVRVHGSFKTGCFGIDFSVVQGIGAQIAELFASPGASTIANAAQILGAAGFITWNGGKGLIAVLKWLRGRPIVKVIETERGAEIHVSDEQIEIEREVLALLRDYDTRQALEAVVKPLTRDGIDVVCFGLEKEIADSIHKSEAPWFAVPTLDEERLEETEYEATLQIARIEFNEDNKWRFTDGEATFYAAIIDDEFLNRINKNEEAFTKGDIIKAHVRKRQRRVGENLKPEYCILRVIEHRSGHRQIRLPLE